ncbi:MAG: glutathione S-transferase [Pseudomonadota bacterium]
MSNAVRIHHFAKSGHAHRALVFAKLAGIAHEAVPVDLSAGAHKSPDFLALNPNGQVPVLEDGEVVVSDSNAILVYLARRYAPDWMPSDAVEEAHVQRWLTLAAGEIAFGSCAARLITVFGAPLDPDFAVATAERAMQKLEHGLTGRDWLVGTRPTIADVANYSYTAHAPEGNVSLEPYPHVRAWLARFEALPNFEAMPATAVGLAAA